MRCPLLYRYRAIDRFEEPPSVAAARGSLVHLVLEALFELPREARTPDAAQALVPDSYQKLHERDQRVPRLFADGSETEESFIGAARDLVDSYFTLEDPTRLIPQSRELLVEARLKDGPLLRGYIDRLEVAPGSGMIRITDYKTGKSPAPRYQEEVFFQLRFYALVVWLTGGRVPDLVQLLYLGNRNILRDQPSEGDLRRTQLKVETIWSQIQRMVEAKEFPPVKGPLCGWCSFQQRCPLFGGQVPDFPVSAGEATATDPG
jgi:putative RecB family exonuclease